MDVIVAGSRSAIGACWNGSPMLLGYIDRLTQTAAQLLATRKDQR